MAASDDFTKWGMSRLLTWTNLAKAEGMTSDELDEDADEITYKKLSEDGTVTTVKTRKRQDILDEVKKDLTVCKNFSKPAIVNDIPAAQLLQQGLGCSIDAIQRTQGMYELTRKDFYDQAELDSKTSAASQVQAYQMMAGYTSLCNNVLKPLEQA